MALIAMQTIDKNDQGMGDRLIRMLSDSVIDINSANNLIVIRTLSGSAHVAGEAVDSLHWPGGARHHRRRQYHFGNCAL